MNLQLLPISGKNITVIWYILFYYLFTKWMNSSSSREIINWVEKLSQTSNIFFFITHGWTKTTIDLTSKWGKKIYDNDQVPSDFLLWVQIPYTPTFCSLTWRVREGRFPDTIILGNSGSVVCSILLQKKKTNFKTSWKFELKSNILFYKTNMQSVCVYFKKNLDG